MSDRRDHADGHADQHDPDHRHGGEQRAGLGAIGDDREDRRLEEDRAAEIAGERMGSPVQILNDDRQIETELVAQRFDLVRRRRVAEQNVDRIAGNEMDEGKDHDRGRHERDRGRRCALQSI